MIEIIKKYDEIPMTILEKFKEGNVFFSKEYNDYAQSLGANIFYAYDDNYVLPISVTEKIKIRQGLYVSEPLCIGLVQGKRKETVFLNDVSNRLRKMGIAWISTSAAALFDVYPDESLRIPFGSHIIDLDLSEEELLMQMNSKHRNSVRRAERNGVTVVSGGEELINDYIKADTETWERSERDSYGFDFFLKILNNLKEKSVLYVAYKNGAPQSGACYFYDKNICYYMYGASITNPEPGSANLLQWEAIKDMKRRGVKKFSFVGCRINEDEDSKYHGIQRFKERFGGKLCQGYMFKTILSQTKYNLFKTMYKIKKGFDMTDAVDQEIHKWPDLQKTNVED